MMGKLSNGSTTRNFYSNIFIRPHFLGRGAKGGDDLWTYEPIPFDSFSSFLHPFRSPKALQAATKAIPATSVVLPAAFEALPAVSKASSATSEAFAATS